MSGNGPGGMLPVRRLGPPCARVQGQMHEELRAAILGNDLKCVERLVAQMPADAIDVRDADGRTALMVACSNFGVTMAELNKHHIVRALLIAKANVMAVDPHGDTALHLVAGADATKEKSGGLRPVEWCMETLIYEAQGGVQAVHLGTD